ncbi:MAG: nucleotidyltransferase domain-containing protein [Candidatus Thorarchaeota archaeon]
MDVPDLPQIRHELEWLSDLSSIQGVLLFGSYVRGEMTPQSDIDLCVVAPDAQTPKEKADLLGRIWKRINADKYDVRLFEELPLHMKMNVIREHEILFCDDVPALFEYFYFYRKLWADQAHKQSLSY